MKNFEIYYECINEGETVAESECYFDEDEAEDRFAEILADTEGLTLLRLTFTKESGGIAYDGGILKEFEPEVIYTGGGIWLACAYVDEHRYAVVENDYDTAAEFLTLYDDTDEDAAQCTIEYPCQSMVWSKDLDELTDEERGWYESLKGALLREMF